jgi:subtilisin family serine protease
MGETAVTMRRFVLFVAALLIAALAAPAGAVNDPLFAQQWGLAKIGAPQAWLTGTGAGTVIGIVDTGIDLGHEDLQGKVALGTSCVGANGDTAKCRGSAQDDNGHGTHVAGIASAVTGNGRGVGGVAPDARLLVARVLVGDDQGRASGTGPDISAGIDWVVAHGATVVNLSLGSNLPATSITGSPLQGAIEAAWSKGVIVVVAAGNDNNTGLLGSAIPSEYRDLHAIVVTATDRNDRVPSYANADGVLVESARWGMAAPGGAGDSTEQSGCVWREDILSTLGYVGNPWPPSQGTLHGYGCESGTSMASPHVAGAAAILRGLGLTPQQTVDRLLATAKDIGDPAAGRGRLDLAAAVAGLGTTATTARPGGSGGTPATARPAQASRTPTPLRVGGATATAGTSGAASGAVMSPPATSSDATDSAAARVPPGGRGAPSHRSTIPGLVALVAITAVAGLLAWRWRRRSALRSRSTET